MEHSEIRALLAEGEGREKVIDMVMKERLEDLDGISFDSDAFETMYEDMLNEVGGEELSLPFNLHITPAELLKEHDPVGYRCGKADYWDSCLDEFIEVDEVLYDEGEYNLVYAGAEEEVEEAEEEKEEPAHAE
jgi:hypothetical protein